MKTLSFFPALFQTKTRFAILFAFSFLLGSCVRDVRAPDTLQLAMSIDPSTLDPAKAYDTSSIQFVRLLYRGLVDYDDNARIVPEVARRFTVSPDGKTYTFVLRDDANFVTRDGAIFRRVEAEDFRFALERVLDPATASDGMTQYSMINGADEYTKAREEKSQKVAHVRGIEVRGDDTIIFKLKQPDATFLNYLALPFAYALPREVVSKLKDPKDLSENPLGSGPFLLDEWVHDGWIHFKRNPHYYKKGFPKTERVEIQIGVSPTLQTMLFEQGRTDTLSLTEANAPEYLRFAQNPQWKSVMQHAPMMDVRYLCMNTELKPFNDVRVRQAMNYAIDRDRIVSFLAGRATKARGALPPGMPAFNDKLFQYAYDPEKARQLLREAGYAKGFGKPITLWYSNAAPWVAMAAQSIQQDLRKVGIVVSTKQTTYSDLKAKAGQRKNIELSMMGWLQDFTDPSNFLDNLFHSRSISALSSRNRAFYSNPKVDQLLNAAIGETDTVKRLKMYQDAETIIVRDAPWVFLHHTERYALRQPWISGYTLHPMWSERYETVRVDDARRGF